MSNSQSRTFALQNVNIIDGTGLAPQHGKTIVVQGTKITQIIDAAKVSPEHASIIDLTGCYAVPGLIDAHVHLAFDGGEDPLATFVNDDTATLQQRVLENAQVLLTRGVTVARDCGSPGTIVQDLSVDIEDGSVVGPRILAAGAPITSPKGHLWFMGGAADDHQLEQSVRDRAASGSRLVKVMASGGNMTPGSDPYQVQFDGTQLQRIVRTAHSLSIPVAAHIHAESAIRMALEAKVDTFEHCSWLSHERNVYNPDLVDQMIRTHVVVSPAVGNTFRSPPESLSADPARRRYLREFQALRYKTTNDMRRAGVEIIVSTDAGVRRTKFDDYWKVFDIFTERFGFKPIHALSAATWRSANALHLGDGTGKIDVGSVADIVVFSVNPLDSLGMTPPPRYVWKAGDLVARDGSLTAETVR